MDGQGAGAVHTLVPKENEEIRAVPPRVGMSSSHKVMGELRHVRVQWVLFCEGWFCFYFYERGASPQSNNRTVSLEASLVVTGHALNGLAQWGQ